MFSYIFMKILEMRPSTYDRAMNKAAHGRVDELKHRVAQEVPDGCRVLEIGCGTGQLAQQMLARAASVDGFDLNPRMVAESCKRIEHEGLKGRFHAMVMGVEGMDRLTTSAYDLVVSTLVFSEMTDDERRFALTHALRVLRPGGRIIVADEVRPRAMLRRALHAATRAPALIATYFVSGSATRSIANLAEEVARAGFTVEKEERSADDTLALIIGVKGNRT
jgi:cyclopropane fatty-acyl-phospholipid synthase-like methyltransferase